MADEESDISAIFGSALREARIQKRYSLRSLGEKVPCSKGHLSKVETGKQPGTLDLAKACDKVLGQDGRLIAAFFAGHPAGDPPPGFPPAPAPFDLPPPPGHLVGRDDDADRIAAAIRVRESGSRAPVVLVHGMPGIGKTALALHVAHRVRGSYPGGCLFLDFGYGRDPGLALSVHARLLRRLGVPAGDIPAEPDEAQARYRSELSRRAVLVVADGVTSAGQVAALVPASSRCAVIATSRRRLDALDDGLEVHLGPLAAGDASALLRAASGRSDLGPDADVRRLATACGGLPLALRVAAARARGSRHDAARLAGLIEGPATVWRHLDDGERSVQRALRAGLDDLPESSRQVLAALALHPAESAARHGAAWLAGRSLDSVDDDFTELAAHDLITVDPQGRASPRSLVRRLAPETAAGLGGPALGRLIAGYARAAADADGAMVPQRFRPGQTRRDAAIASLAFRDPAQAMGWCRAEARLTPRLCSLALEQGLDEECWRLAYAMRDYFFAARDVGPWVDSHRTALRAAERSGNDWAQAATRNNLGMAYAELGRIAEAAAQHVQALAILRELGDEHGVATTLGHQAWAHHAAGRHEAALALARDAAELHRRLGNHRSVAIMCRTAALAHSGAGRHGDALRLLDECGEILSGLDLPLDRVMTLNCRGEVHHAMGDSRAAVAFHTRAVELGQACRGAGEQTRAIRGLAAASKAIGRADEVPGLCQPDP